MSDPYNPQNQPPQDYTYYPQPNQQSQQPGYIPPNPNAYGEPYNNSGYGPQYAPQFPPPAGPGGGLAIAGLVLGIVSVVFCWIPFVNIGVSVVGIILSILGRRSVSRRTLAIVGLILSIIGLVLGLCVSGIVVAGIISASHSTPSSSY